MIKGDCEYETDFKEKSNYNFSFEKLLFFLLNISWRLYYN